MLIHGSGLMGLMMLELAKRTVAAAVDMAGRGPDHHRGIPVTGSTAVPAGHQRAVGAPAPGAPDSRAFAGDGLPPAGQALLCFRAGRGRTIRVAP